jgi:hypothetical protein
MGFYGLSNGAQVKAAALTAPAAVSSTAVTGRAVFHGFIMQTDGSNNVTMNIYDNTVASGTTLMPVDCVILGASRIYTFSYDPPVPCNTGIYVEVTVAGGGDCSYQVLYET